MNKTAIITSDSPAPIGPYSQAIQHHSLLFVSGQIAINPESGQMVQTNINLETIQVMKNIEAILFAGKSDWSKVLKATIYIRDMACFKEINEVYSSFMQEPFPARETVEVSKLPKDAQVEISVIAAI